MSKLRNAAGILLMSAGLMTAPADAKAEGHTQLPFAVSLTAVFLALGGAGVLGIRASSSKDKNNTPKND